MMAFDDVVGHQKPLQILHRAIMTGRVHHAYLFTGMEGIGKKKVALNMAKALNCSHQGGEACDQCSVCQRMEQGIHPDLILINPDGDSIKIGQIRELQRSIAFKPFEARWRAIIMDGAERMTREASNAFLKTLEEPPPWTTIILVATAVEGLPATVLSRCQRIRFTPLSQEEVKRVLSDLLSAKEIGILAPLAGGSPGRALQTDCEEVMQVKDSLPSAIAPSLSRRLQLARETARQEGRGKIFLEILEGWLRDLVVYQETGEEKRLLNRDIADKVKKAAPHYTTEVLLRNFWSLLHTQRGIDAHGNLQLALESALLEMGGI